MILAAFLAFWLFVCGYALWRGGAPERAAAAVFLLAFPASRVAFLTGWHFHGLAVGVLLVDLAMLLPLVWIALRANRQWPIPMAAMQMLGLAGHFLKLAEPSMLPLLYWLGRIAWAYPMLVLLALATLRHVNRERRLGAEPPW
ncbi:hypothetical protein AB5I39_08575 [Sphingomonas sp. MMS24-J45]|uniref:hypothetical protein n=1 Tax=Sphingomonas sp. MMS24-J45 TaxID=3238806 RepID=UPI00384C3BC7